MHGPRPSSIARQAGPDCTRATDFLYAGPCYRVRVPCRLGSLRRAFLLMLRSRLLACNGCTKSSTTGSEDGKRVKLYSRPGNDLTYRFPLIVEAIAGDFGAFAARKIISGAR